MTAKRLFALAEEALTHSIIGAFFEVYNTLGYGFLESVYVEALVRELRRRRHRVEREALVKVWYKGEIIARQRVDLLVDEKIVIEVKAGPQLPPTASRQLCNYIRGSDKEVGLLLFFGPAPRYFREYRPTNNPIRSSDESGNFSRISNQSPGGRRTKAPVGDGEKPK
ncbi:MAG TPA: GxxExxY protein [Gemmatimonadaceae bacterium]|nr:GxxExxY protein [Gemmatimonadaceae bacterium]